MGGVREGVIYDGAVIYRPLAPVWEENADSEWPSELTPRDLVEDVDYAYEAAEDDEEAAYDVASMEHWVGVLERYARGDDVPEQHAMLVNGLVVVDGYHRMAAAWYLGFEVFPMAEVDDDDA